MTSLGNIDVTLHDNQDPLTVQNFLNYVTTHRLDQSLFHRLASGFVLQGGGYTLAAGPAVVPVVTDPAVKGEASATQTNANVRGTIAMALSSGPDTGTSQYFFNLVNNSSALDGTTDGGPFTVFANIADPFSQRVVDNLSSQPTSDESKAAGAAINTVQKVTIKGNPTGGTFTLSLGGTATAPLAFNASVSDVAAAIAALPSPTGTSGATIGAANVSVTGNPRDWVITFVGNLAGTSVPQLTSVSTGLTGGTNPVAAVTVVIPGSAVNGALNQIPLTGAAGSNFPTSTAPSSFEVVQSVQILRNTEHLTYSITGNTNPTAATARLSDTANNLLNLHFGTNTGATALTTTITVVATDLSNKSVTSTFTVTLNPGAVQPPVIANQTFKAAAGRPTAPWSAPSPRPIPTRAPFLPTRSRVETPTTPSRSATVASFPSPTLPRSTRRSTPASRSLSK